MWIFLYPQPGVRRTLTDVERERRELSGGFVSNVLKQVAAGQTLTEHDAEQFMNHLMDGETTPIQTAGLLAAMAVRGETVAEIVGFARAMRKHARHIDVAGPLIDTCGTGGDGLNTFNISTASAIVAAAAGVRVAKHGNRAASSRSGSADVLQALGVRIDLHPVAAARCLEETGLCFLFAQGFHPAMKHAAEPRKQLGFRTVFNILGPLTNPAGATRQVLGVPRPDLVRTMAEALSALGSEHALVVHGHGGIDEFSLAGETLVAEVRDGRVTEYTVDPAAFGLTLAPVEAIAGGTPEDNAAIILEILQGGHGPKRDVVLLNAGAALFVGGAATSIQNGVQKAGSIIDEGAARDKLAHFVAASQRYSNAEVAQ